MPFLRTLKLNPAWPLKPEVRNPESKIEPIIFLRFIGELPFLKTDLVMDSCEAGLFWVGMDTVINKRKR